MTAVELLASSFQLLDFVAVSESERYVDSPILQRFPFNFSRSLSKFKEGLGKDKYSVLDVAILQISIRTQYSYLPRQSFDRVMK